jgi:hypothetical protein
MPEWTEGEQYVDMEGKTYQKAPQQWQQKPVTFKAGTSFADVRLTIYENDRSVPNAFYVDDIKMVRVMYGAGGQGRVLARAGASAQGAAEELKIGRALCVLS